MENKSLCDSCTHEKGRSGCELYCYGVVTFDEEREIVTACEDYKEE